jgi:serine/threonine protein phosphatase PrpC
MIDVEFGAATSVGRVREHNEDDYIAGHSVFAVADGMGGHAAGEVASGIAVGELHKLVDLPAIQPSDVAEALSRANEQILRRSEQDVSHSGMGTTISGLVAGEAAGLDHWIVFNVGDSRVYRLFDGSLRQLSTDHSEVQELIATGEIDRAEARVHPRRNVVTRSLGTTPPPRADQWLLPPTLGERFLVCSDGLCAELTDREIEESLSSTGSPQAIADNLVARAVSAGGRDNVTALVVAVSGISDNGVDEDTIPRAAVRST